MTFTPVWNRGLEFIIFGNQSTLWLQAIWGQLAGKSSHQRKTLLVWEPPAPNLQKWNARKMKSSQRPLMKGGSRQSSNSRCENLHYLLERHWGDTKGSGNHKILQSYLLFFFALLKCFQRPKAFQTSFCCRHVSSPSPVPTPEEAMVPAAALIQGTLPMLWPGLNIWFREDKSVTLKR